MTEDNNQDRSQSEGQEGIDRETELRNRENETGQAQNQQFGQDTSQPTTAQNQDSGTSSFGQQGQSAGGDTSLSERTGQTGGQALTGQTNPEGFVGSDSDDSSDYLTSPVPPPRRTGPAPTRGHERTSNQHDDGPPESAYGTGVGIVS